MVEFGESVHFRPVDENNAMRGGEKRMLRGVYVGHHERSGAAVCLTPHGVNRGTRIARMLAWEIGWRVQCDMCRRFMAIEGRTAEAGETLWCAGDRDARCPGS